MVFETDDLAPATPAEAALDGAVVDHAHDFIHIFLLDMSRLRTRNQLAGLRQQEDERRGIDMALVECVAQPFE